MKPQPAERGVWDAFVRLGHPQILVLGDLILDCYTFGNAERVSQEAPVILLRADERENRLGGAANVCHMLRGLEARVTCVGVTGADADALTLRRLLTDAGVDVSLAWEDSQRPTTVKERFIGRAANRHPHQMLRVDREARDLLADSLVDRLLAEVKTVLPQQAAVLISDYQKGVCTPRMVSETIAAARRVGVPVLVDPLRAGDYRLYQRATTITPNRLEAETASGVRIASLDDARRAGERLCRDLELNYAVVTLDRDGMLLVGPEGVAEHFPTRAKAVYDITGAGDMVLAMIGLAVASGISPADACRLANVAAGIEVERVGVAIVRRDEIAERLAPGGSSPLAKRTTLDALAARVEGLRREGRSLAVAYGDFWPCTAATARWLEWAAAQADVLVLALTEEVSCPAASAAEREAPMAERAALLSALAVVDHVIVLTAAERHSLLWRLRPEVLLQEHARAVEQVIGQRVVRAYGGRVCVLANEIGSLRRDDSENVAA